MMEQLSGLILKTKQRIEASQFNIYDVVARVPFQGSLEVFFGRCITAEAVGVVEVNHTSQIIRHTHELVTSRVLRQVIRSIYHVSELLFSSCILPCIVKNYSWKVVPVEHIARRRSGIEISPLVGHQFIIIDDHDFA